MYPLLENGATAVKEKYLKDTELPCSEHIWGKIDLTSKIFQETGYLPFFSCRSRKFKTYFGNRW